MLCNESFKLDQVAFAAEGIKNKDAQQTVCATIPTFLKFAIDHPLHRNDNMRMVYLEC